MDQPTFLPARRVASDVHLFPSFFPLPGLGVVAVNCFLLHAKEPVLIDTGLPLFRRELVQALQAIIDPAELKWIWVTHTHPEHIGSLAQVLEAAPAARIVTTYLGMGELMLNLLPVDRVYLLNPGQLLDVGDRRLLCLRPPTYDSPETTAMFDMKGRTLFSADCFGALLSEPADAAAEVAPARLREGMLTWASIDAPWLASEDRDQFDEELSAVRALDPELVLSSHLPPAAGLLDRLLDNLAAAPGAPPFVGPDQSTFDRMMRAAASSPAEVGMPGQSY